MSHALSGRFCHIFIKYGFSYFFYSFSSCLIRTPQTLAAPMMLGSVCLLNANDATLQQNGMIREYIFFLSEKTDTSRPYLLCLSCELRPNRASQAEMGRSVTQLRNWVAPALFSALGCHGVSRSWSSQLPAVKFIQVWRPSPH